MAKCDFPDLYENLELCPGESSLPGIVPEIYGISKRSITKRPTLPDLTGDVSDLSSIATLTGNFEVAADTGFHKIDILSPSSGVKSEPQGEWPNISYLNTLTAVHAGTGPEATGYCRLASHDDMIFVVRQRSGNYRVIGSWLDNTKVSPSQDLGQAVTDSSGTTLEITATDRCPAPFYKGKLPLVGGKILNCATGEITEALD